MNTLIWGAVAGLAVVGCSKGPMPEKYLEAAKARAEAICACQKGEPAQGPECVKKAKAAHAEPEGRPGKQDVSEGSWKAYEGFGDVAFKCEMAVNSASNAAKSED